MFCFFFFKQKTAYEMRISDWSSDVCSSDLPRAGGQRPAQRRGLEGRAGERLAAAAEQPGGAVMGDHRLLRLVVVGEEGDGLHARLGQTAEGEIGRASCRARVGKLVEIRVVGVQLKKKKKETER